MGWTTEVQFVAGATMSFSSLPHPNRLWVSPSLLSSGYLGLLPWG